MSTGMYRLQISLSPNQMEFLRQRAKRDGYSIAHVIRELVERASTTDAHLNQAEIAQVMSLAGIARDLNPLVGGVPVSENPDLYLVDAFDQSRFFSFDKHLLQMPQIRRVPK